MIQVYILFFYFSEFEEATFLGSKALMYGVEKKIKALKYVWPSSCKNRKKITPHMTQQT